MSSRSDQSQKHGSSCEKNTKKDAVPQASTSAVPLQTDQQTRTKEPVSRFASRIEARQIATEKLFEAAAKYADNTDVKDRRRQDNTSSLPPSPENTPLTIHVMSGPGRISWPPLPLQEPIPKNADAKVEQNALAKHARYMKAVVDTTIDLRPGLVDEVYEYTDTAYFQDLRDRMHIIRSRRRFLAEHGIPTIEYTGSTTRSFKMWTGKRLPPTSYEKGLGTPKARRDALLAFLHPGDAKTKSTVFEIENHRKICSELVNKEVALVTSSPEFDMFASVPQYSLVIHGNQKSDQSASTSLISGLLWKNYDETKNTADSSIILTHCLGLSEINGKPSASHLKGTIGLLRSLCTQILTDNAIGKHLDLHWLARKHMQKAKTNAGTRQDLTFILRHLVLNIADHAVERKHLVKIRVIVDGIEFLEEHGTEQDYTLEDFIDLFRGLSDEIESGPLDEHIGFKYILMNAGISVLGVSPHANELHLICDRQQDEGRSGEGLQERGDTSQTTLDIVPREVMDEYKEQIHHMASSANRAWPDHGMYWEEVVQQMARRVHKDVEKGKKMAASQKRGEDGAIPHKFPKDETGTPTDCVLRFWSSTYPVPGPHAFPHKLRSRDARRLALFKALYGPDNRPPMNDEEICYQGLRCEETSRLKKFQNSAEIALEHPELAYYVKRGSGGLVIHGQDSEGNDEGDEDRMSPFGGLMNYNFGGYPNILRFTYGAGYDLVNQTSSNGPSIGTQGCLRQLCSQIIRQKTLWHDGLGLTFLGLKSLFHPLEVAMHAISDGRVPILLALFLSLIYDIALTVYEKKVKKQVVEIIIDGVDYLDDDPQFEFVVELFRSICRETAFAELGKYIQFRYLLLHSGRSDCAERPTLLERHLFWDAGPIEKGPSGDGESDTITSGAEASRQEWVEHLAIAMERMDNHFGQVDLRDYLTQLFVTKEEVTRTLTLEINDGQLRHLDYAWGENCSKLPFWSQTQDHPKSKHPPGLNSARKRQHSLEIALNSESKKRSGYALAKDDRQRCAESYFDSDCQNRISELCELPDLQRFFRGSLQGLWIHHFDRDGTNTDEDFDIVESLLATFVTLTYWHEAKNASIPMSHVNTATGGTQNKRAIRDAKSIVRSLCCQFIDRVSKSCEEPMDFDYVDESLLTKISDGDLDAIFVLFRQLLCDLASHVARHSPTNSIEKKRVVAIVDCDELDDNPSTGLPAILQIFRAICDETSVGELGRFIDFRYLLLRPHRAYVTPCIRERHVFLADIERSGETPASERSDDEVHM